MTFFLFFFALETCPSRTRGWEREPSPCWLRIFSTSFPFRCLFRFLLFPLSVSYILFTHHDGNESQDPVGHEFFRFLLMFRYLFSISFSSLGSVTFPFFITLNYMCSILLFSRSTKCECKNRNR